MKILKTLSLLALVMMFGSANAANITLYYSPTCPHCHHARDFIENELIYEYDDLNVTLVNAFENRDKFIEVIKKCNYTNGGVPVIVIGEKCFQGYGDSMQGDIRAAVEVGLNAEQKQSAADNKASFDKDKKSFVASRAERKSAVSEFKKKLTNDKTNTTNIALFVLITLLAIGFTVIVFKKQK